MARTATEPTEPTATELTDAPEPHFPNLARLIGAGEVTRFLQTALGREAFRASSPPGWVRSLFGWSQLNAALAEHRLTPPRLRLERAGGDATASVFRSRRSRRGAVLQDLDSAALSAALREGATLILDAANEVCAPLQQLCAGLAAEFTASCQANMYACWGTTQGFNVHWDDHDVFVVQVEGQKRWALYGATEPCPTRRGAGAAASAPDGPAEVVVLEPGDVLYLPRGYWHAAVGLGGPTMHLTIGLTRKTGADVLHWLADDALSEMLVRADLPFEAGDAAVGARIGEILAGIAERDPQSLARSYRRQVEAGLAQRARMSFPYIGASDEALLAPDLRITLADGPARLVPGPADDFVLSWRGVEFTIAAVLAAPLRRLLAGETVAARGFQDAAAGTSDAGVQTFLREMLRRGAFLATTETQT